MSTGTRVQDDELTYVPSDVESGPGPKRSDQAEPKLRLASSSLPNIKSLTPNTLENESGKPGLSYRDTSDGNNNHNFETRRSDLSDRTLVEQHATKHRERDSAQGFDSGWLTQPTLTTTLTEFLQSTEAAASERSHTNTNDIAVSLVAVSMTPRGEPLNDPHSSQAILFREQQDTISNHWSVNTRRLGFSNCGEIGHEIQWTAIGEDDGKKKEARPEALCLWFQSPDVFVHGIWLCVRLHLGSGCATAVYWDRNEDRLKWVAKKITTLRAWGGNESFSGWASLWNWIFGILGNYSHGVDNWRNLLDRQVVLLEGDMSDRAQGIEMGRGTEYTFGRVTMSMQNKNIGLLELEKATKWQAELWRFLRKMVVLEENLVREVGGKGMERSCMEKLLVKLDDWELSCTLKMGELESLQKRMVASISTLHSLISQRDNWMNMQLGQDMRSTSMAAKKDSRVMKVIAAMTLVFLPATLISSIFSTGIFNVGFVDDKNPRVSDLWWVFVLITSLSTMIVMFLGYLFLREDMSLDNLSMFRDNSRR